MSRARIGEIAPATTTRTISCRKLSPVLDPVSSPDSRSSSDACGGTGMTDASSGTSTRVPISAAVSSASRAAALSRDARASTASRADAGTSPMPD
jgi:hypothetical protein